MPRRKPPVGMTARELTEATGISAAQLHRWVAAGLLPRPRRGRGARYDVAFVERAKTIDALLRDGMYLEDVREHLDRLAKAPPPTPAVPDLPSDRLERLVLIPGLELTFRADAGPVLRRMAAEIWKQFGSTAGR